MQKPSERFFRKKLWALQSIYFGLVLKDAKISLPFEVHSSFVKGSTEENLLDVSGTLGKHEKIYQKQKKP